MFTRICFIFLLVVSCTQKTTDIVSSASETETDAKTSATVVPQNLVFVSQPKGFTANNKKKVLFVLGDPRDYSVLSYMSYKTIEYLEQQGFEVELRDLYKMNWNPILSEEEFYYQKDGEGTIPEELLVEQQLVTKADYIIFSYPNWHDTPIAIVKGYMERVFASGFAYTSTPQGPKGLLEGKAIFTIMNAGFLGGGRGDMGDGRVDKRAWDSYMGAFKVLDDDTARWWGMENLGRFVNDRNPQNESPTYATELQDLHTDLTNHLRKTFL
ncbi:MAG: NAD(P)H-dependent oxidoreductase [Chitinophagaceae bacterium]